MEMGGYQYGFYYWLTKNKEENDSIFIVINKLAKGTHFIPIKSTYKAVKIADIFLEDIFRLHGIHKVILLDRDVKFT